MPIILRITILKKLILLASIMCSALFSPAQFSSVTDIDDLALIYIGSQHRNTWTKELFKPYVMHTYSDGTQSWMFDGFLMIEFQAWNEDGVVVSLGESNGQGAKKTDWERLIRVQLGIEDGNGCRALDDLIGELIPVLGEPGHKHKVVLCLPMAEAKSAATWGKIGARQLNFQYVEDRIEGMKWYIDYVLDLWKQQNFKHIELDGVYWTKEAFGDYEKTQITQMNNYYHSKGLKTYWVPYSTAEGREKWKEFGIDVAYLQPNYYFDASYPKSRLDYAIDFAWNNDTGLEMEFEGYNFSWSPATGLIKYSAANNGLYGHSPVYYQRFVDYIDSFEAADAFEFFPMAYYSGFQGVYDFVTSGHPKDAEIIDRLASIINRRHVSTGWDKEPSAGIEDAVTGSHPIVYGIDGAIYIADDAGDDVAVYSTDGQLVYSRAAGAKDATGRLKYGMTVPCRQGIYIVKVGAHTIKVAVK